MKKYDYVEKDIFNSLQSIGLKEGDSIFIHSNLGFFGRLKSAKNQEDYCNSFLNSFKKILGESGTIVVPTFSYSFCNKKYFDINNTMGICGMFSEYLRDLPESTRSEDPNFSITAIGKNAKFFTEKPTENSFDKNSFWSIFWFSQIIDKMI